MGNNDAIQALEASLAGDSGTPDFGHGDRESYLQEQRSELRACIIEPTSVLAHAGTWAQQNCGLSADPYHMIAVARYKGEVETCLLYNPETELFSLAYGDPNSPKGVELVGYSSDDALAMWLG